MIATTSATKMYAAIMLQCNKIPSLRMLLHHSAASIMLLTTTLRLSLSEEGCKASSLIRRGSREAFLDPLVTIFSTISRKFLKNFTIIHKVVTSNAVKSLVASSKIG